MSKVNSSDCSAEDDVSWDDTSVISIKDIATVCVPRWARVSCVMEIVGGKGLEK